MEDYKYLYGTNKYNLPGTRKDAQDLRDFAKMDLRTPDEQYLSFHDSPGDNKFADRLTMLNGIRSLKGKVDADDNLVVVFSGHGGLKESSNAPYLVFNGDYLSPVAFTQALDEVGAGTTCFINDSCHSEAFNERVTPVNTTFTGFAATQANKTSNDTASGGELIKNLKGQLRRCRSLGRSMELTTEYVTRKYQDEPEERDRQQPVLTNPGGASLEGKPWNDPAGIEQKPDQVFRSPPYPGIVAGGTYTIVGSVDPNDKYTLAGAGPEHWIHTDQVLPFEILFENQPTAAAPAQEVLVTDDLDPNLDWSTFELKTIAFNDARIAVPPGLQRFSTTARVGSDPNEVTVDVSFDSTTGRITWLLRSHDAATGDLPEDPFAGFLPPNDAAHRGEGSLTYTIRPRLGLADGTPIRNRATIIFDPTYGANPPILTPVVTNTVDSVAPTSQVGALPAEATGSMEVTWSGQDAAGGSGITSYDVYVARDAAGNTEAAPDTADATTVFAGGATFETWIATQGVPANARGPADEPDQDGLANFAEYALALNPLVKDSQLARPQAGLVQAGGSTYLAITYRRPKTEPADVRYIVTRSDAVHPWVGTSAVMPVGAPVDRGMHVEVTVRSADPLTARAQGYLRLEIRK